MTSPAPFPPAAREDDSTPAALRKPPMPDLRRMPGLAALDALAARRRAEAAP